ncbi:MAG: sulfite exporter TauE/SafE family protein [Candidatus Acidiferrales bacterium]
MHWGEGAFLFFAALAAGALNSVAGGGSFISFPSLLFARIAPISANATNTMALWPGTIASTVAYRDALRNPQVRKLLPPLLVNGIVGGALGAYILLRTPQNIFMRLVPWLLLGATLLFLASGRITAWVRGQSGHARGRRMLFAGGMALELAIAIYIGYFGAGAGILTLGMLALLGIEDIHAMNGTKTLLVSVVNAVALILFVSAKVIVWPEAIVMLAGAAAGGYGGAYWAQKVNPRAIRAIVIVVGFGMAAYFFATQFA